MSGVNSYTGKAGMVKISRLTTFLNFNSPRTKYIPSSKSFLKTPALRSVTCYTNRRVSTDWMSPMDIILTISGNSAGR